METLWILGFYDCIQSSSRTPLTRASSPEGISISWKNVWGWHCTQSKQKHKKQRARGRAYLCSRPETAASVSGPAGCWVAWGCWRSGCESFLLGLACSWHWWWQHRWLSQLHSAVPTPQTAWWAGKHCYQSSLHASQTQPIGIVTGDILTCVNTRWPYSWLDNHSAIHS